MRTLCWVWTCTKLGPIPLEALKILSPGGLWSGELGASAVCVWALVRVYSLHGMVYMCDWCMWFVCVCVCDLYFERWILVQRWAGRPIWLRFAEASVERWTPPFCGIRACSWLAKYPVCLLSHASSEKGGGRRPRPRPPPAPVGQALGGAAAAVF